MGKTAIVFPGQGAQSVGMGRDVAAISAAARATFDEANQILGFDLARICFDGPAERLDATDVSQPAIFVTSVAIWRALDEVGRVAELSPAGSAGLSLGEYTALWLAGSLTFTDGLRLVRTRGELMQAAAEAAPSGMVSVMGLTPEQVGEVCREAGAGEVLSAANFNAPGQVVISGAAAACERSLAAIEARGGRGVPLRVAGAFHSDLMRPAAERLRDVLRTTAVVSPRIPVVSNVTSDYHRDPDSIRHLLELQVAQPIRWHDSMERMIADGFDCFVEVGPGRVLTGLMRKINRTVKTQNYSTSESLGRAEASARSGG